jgi:hypothetical protein
MPPGEEPRLYWQPALGHFCSLRPLDMESMTPRQWMDAVEFAQAASRAR